MRAIKGFILFCFLGSFISGCFDAPEFSNKPQITFKSITFKETPAIADYDTLVLIINFKDGNGDLGLDADDPRDSDYPFNDVFYYLATGSQLADTVRVSTAIASSDTDEFIILDSILNESPNNTTGILVTNKLKNTAGFGNLPDYDPSLDCTLSDLYYQTQEVLVPESFNAVNTTTNTILDTLFNQSTGERYFLVKEALLYKRNKTHHNIEVNFFEVNIKNNGDIEYVKYDWLKNYCVDFDGRFPRLGGGNSPLEGTIRYTMANPSFKAIFGGKQLVLSIKIRDRALHQSDSILTPSFNLLN